MPSILTQPQRQLLESGADFAETQIVGAVRSVLYRSPEGDWTIAKLDGDRCAAGVPDGELAIGIAYTFIGNWTTHPKHGPTFEFAAAIPCVSQNQMGTIAYLSRCVAAGLTRSEASKLWATYGSDTLRVIREDHARASEEAGVSVDKCRAVSAVLNFSAAEESTKIALWELFAGRGFPRQVVGECVRTWGQAAPTVIRRDPFQLMVREIRGCGFKRCDKLFLDLGGNPLRLKRQMLAGWYALHTSTTGNTWDGDDVFARAILQAAGSMALARFDRALELGVRSGWVSSRADESTGQVYYCERHHAEAEKKLARHVLRLLTYQPRWPTIPDDSPASEHQREQIRRISASPFAILAGTPGAGKTFTAAVLLREILKKTFPGSIAVCAPTGKAAVRISEAMKKYDLPLEAATIHRTLGVQGYGANGYEFGHGERNPLKVDLVVIDEGSMVDTQLMADALAAVPPGANVLIVGDPYQLPPVGHGAPLRDLIASGVCPVGLLTEIKRNSGAIVNACRAIKDGEVWESVDMIDEAAGLNLKHIETGTEEEQQQWVIQLLSACGARGYNSTWDVQVLCATNERGRVSRKDLNVMIQAFLNPIVTEIPESERNPMFRVGDKVICLKNCIAHLLYFLGGDRNPGAISSYQKTPETIFVANGDMGRVEAVSQTEAVVRFFSPERLIKVATKRRKPTSEDNPDAVDQSGDNVDFDLAYAVTTHKSQGSEWPVVIVIVDENGGAVANREWVYTAISRASKLCFTVGRMATAIKQSRRVGLQKRKTFLKELLTERTVENGSN